MQQNPKNNGHRAGAIAGRFAAEKKKMAIALCLISLMVFMWVRVLGKKGPASADAVILGEQTNATQSIPQLKISFIELPHIKGRHDVLTRDFFTVENWRDFVDTEVKSSADGKEVSVVSKGGLEEVSKLIAEKLKLEVIELGRVPQAFINGRLLTAGDRLQVSDGINKYECEVLKIQKNTVCLRCGSTEVQLKLIQSTEETAGQ